MSRDVNVEFGAETSELEGKLHDVGGDFKELFESIMRDVKEMSTTVQKEMREAAKSLDGVNQETKKISKSFANIKSGAGKLFAGVGFAEVIRNVINTAEEFDQLRASVERVDKGNGGERFKELKQFARQTPYDVKQSVEAFKTLQTEGLNPSADALRSYGNIATGTGKSLEQVSEIAVKAASGEFNALKQLGVSAKQQGDNVVLSFKGQTETIRRSSGEIQKYLQDMGNTEYAGAMDAEMGSMAASMENLKETAQSLSDDIGQGGLLQALGEVSMEMTNAGSESESMAASLGQGLGTAVLAVWDIITGFGDVVGAVFTGVSDIIGSVINSTNQDADSSITAWQAVQLMINGFAGVVKMAMSVVANAVRAAADAFIAFGRAASSVLSMNWSGAVDAYRDWAVKQKQHVQKATNDIVGILQKGKARQDAILAGPPKPTPRPSFGGGYKAPSGLVGKPSGGGGGKKSGGGGGGGSNKMSEWKDELQKRIEAEVGFFKDSSKLEIDFWNSKLKLVSAKSKEAQQIRRQLFQLEKGQAKEALDVELDAIDEKQDAAKDDMALQLRLQDEKVAAIIRTYGEDSQQYRNVLREKNRMLRDHAKEAISIERDRINKIEEINRIGTDTAMELMRIELEDRKSAIADAADMGEINPRDRMVALAQALSEEVAMELNHEQTIFNIKANSIRSQIALYAEISPERRKLLDELEILEVNHNARMDQMKAEQAAKIRQYNRDVARETKQMWTDTLDPIGQTFNGILQGMAQQTDSFRNLFIGAMDNLFSQFISNVVNMGQQWLVQQLGMTTASQTQNAIRLASDATSSATSAAVTSAAGTAQIATNAAVGASGAFAATAPIPFVGPALAPGVAAAAMAAILGFGSLLSARGGMDIPSGQNPLTQLHEEEMVLPAHLANPLRSLIAGAGPRKSNLADSARGAGEAASSRNTSQTNSFSYAPNVSGSGDKNLETMLSKEGAAMRRWFNRQVRNGKIKAPD